MSMDEFVQTLSKEQKEALIKALGGNVEVESRWQHEEPLSEAVDNITEDFRVVKGNNLQSDSRRESVKAKCHACGKTNEVNASLVFGEYYRCENCVG